MLLGARNKALGEAAAAQPRVERLDVRYLRIDVDDGTSAEAARIVVVSSGLGALTQNGYPTACVRGRSTWVTMHRKLR